MNLRTLEKDPLFDRTFLVHWILYSLLLPSQLAKIFLDILMAPKADEVIRLKVTRDDRSGLERDNNNISTK